MSKPSQYKPESPGEQLNKTTTLVIDIKHLQREQNKFCVEVYRFAIQLLSRKESREMRFY